MQLVFGLISVNVLNVSITFDALGPVVSTNFNRYPLHMVNNRHVQLLHVSVIVKYVKSTGFKLMFIIFL